MIEETTVPQLAIATRGHLDIVKRGYAWGTAKAAPLARAMELHRDSCSGLSRLTSGLSGKLTPAENGPEGRRASNSLLRARDARDELSDPKV
jgi:hypothetical protein